MAEEAYSPTVLDHFQHPRNAGTPDAPDAVTLLQPLTAKPVLYVANVEEGSHEVPPQIIDYARSRGAAAVAISARLGREFPQTDGRGWGAVVIPMQEAIVGNSRTMRLMLLGAVGPGTLTKDDGDPYRVFTPFSKAWLRHGWPAPVPVRYVRDRLRDRPLDPGVPESRTSTAACSSPSPWARASRGRRPLVPLDMCE